ncbi:hypothetical protein [Microbacterium sp. H1-D42]|uniref:hypothetical protein n=1 Tax=Microbacterium sp. H1-D42 TaxID=2925844 RepID=UPI001F532D75|nr:hypothetical protein [Microbacterium sp. H1-D42]UNK71202.1 hypothetical protein MNR00_01760 [Microbacterium sp. H1-D42]
MIASRAAGIIVAASVALTLTACSAGTEEDPMPTPDSSSTAAVQDPNPAEPIAQIVSGADVIVRGVIESVEPAVEDADKDVFAAQTATVRVEAVLKGDAPAEISVVKPAGTYYYLVDQAQESHDAKHEGLFALKNTGAGYELFGFVGVFDDSAAPRTFARLLAGGPERLPEATPAQLEEWAKRADIIVFAAARGDSDDMVLHTPRIDFSASATLEPIEVLKGEMPGPLSVVQGPQPEVPGGTWAFPIKDSGQTGVYFIDTSGEVPVVINTTEPSRINQRRVPLGD